MARIKSNAREVSAKLKRYARKLRPEILRDAMFLSLEEVGIVAAVDHMIPTTNRATALTQPTAADKLTMRTGRLIGSVVGSFRFSEVNLPSSVKSLISGKYGTSSEGFEGGKKESIREVKVGPGQLIGIIGSKVPYAEFHEPGEREFFEPAAKESMPTILDIFEEAITETFRRAKI